MSSVGAHGLLARKGARAQIGLAVARVLAADESVANTNAIRGRIDVPPSQPKQSD
jgi:hypothetical protein